MGAILVSMTVGVLVADQPLAPWFPFLFLLTATLAVIACAELLGLLAGARHPRAWLCYTAVIAMILGNWLPHVWRAVATLDSDPWHWILGLLTVSVMGAFLVEMAAFREPGDSVARIASTVWIVAYVGLLPAFLIQLRWLGSVGTGTAIGIEPGLLALALAIFVPKCGDIGAYFAGRFLGQHRMSPVLSPKKSWEGAAGGIIASTAAAIGINRLGPVLTSGIAVEIAFGLTVGVAGILGDLAESLIKRDCRQKEASLTVPGFGGILDVIDSVVFAAPVAYCWFALNK
jgi:phosphatidate cytidylyltransferase